jgi:hypothetical protein
MSLASARGSLALTATAALLLAGTAALCPQDARAEIVLRGSQPVTPWKSTSTRKRPAVAPPRVAAPVAVREVGDAVAIRPVGDPAPVEPVPELVPPALPALVAADRRPRKNLDDPYEPLGLRLGSFDVLPFVEQSVGYDSNPNLLANVDQGSVVLKTEAGFTARSDWSTHEVEASLRGAYYLFTDTPSADRPEGDALLRLRLDANRDTAVEFSGNASLSTQQPGTLEQPLIGNQRSQILGAGVGAGVIRSLGPLTATLRGTFQHFDYENLDCDGCAQADQSFRNYSVYGGSLRLGYEVHPGFRPFIESTVDQRVYDQSIDPLGFARNSLGLTGSVGLAVDITRVVRGEVSLGYGGRSYDDARRDSLKSPIFDASIVWTPTALTSVTFTASNSLADTTVATSAGSTVQSFGVEVAHALRRNITLTGFAGTAITSYEGLDTEETGINAGLKLDYKLNRSMVVRTSFTHLRQQSSAPDSDYTANIFLVGLRLQR